MDWKTVGNYVLLVGLFVAMVSMFNQLNAVGRLDTLQAETGDEPALRRLSRCRPKTSASTMPCRRCCASSRGA